MGFDQHLHAFHQRRPKFRVFKLPKLNENQLLRLDIFWLGRFKINIKYKFIQLGFSLLKI